MLIFAGKEGKYAKYRTGYPEDAVRQVLINAGMEKNLGIVADIAAGTGILSKRMKDINPALTIVAVEPNPQMRAKIKRSIAIAIDGSAEKTQIEANSVNLLVVGTAAHWFQNYNAVRAEFRRILKPRGKVAILHIRLNQENSLTSALHKFFIDHCPGDLYKASKVGHIEPRHTEIAARYISEATMQPLDITYRHSFSEQQFLGWLQSQSYYPINHPEIQTFEKRIKAFHRQRRAESGLLTLYFEVNIDMGLARAPEKKTDYNLQPTRKTHPLKGDNTRLATTR